MFDRVLLVVLAQRRQFPGGGEPFKMVTRLAEECGEVAAEVQRWEGEGLKQAKGGPPDRSSLAKELMDVLSCALTIADHYELIDDLQARIELSISRAAKDGWLTPEEASG